MGDSMQSYALPTHNYDPYDKKAKLKRKANCCRNFILMILVLGIILAFKYLAELTYRMDAVTSYTDDETGVHPDLSVDYELNQEDQQLQWSQAQLEFNQESDLHQGNKGREMTDDTEYTFLENQ